MAFGDRTALGSVADKAASTTRTITTSATAPAGRAIVVGVSGRDSTGSGLNFGVTDSAGNTYTEIEFVTGASNMSAFLCANPVQLSSGGTITISGCESGQAIAAGAISCEGVATSSALESQNDGQGSSDGTTSGDISYVGTNGDELWIGFMSVSSSTAGTDDADYSTADIAVTTTGGTITQNRSMRMQGRVVTGALTDNYNATTGGTQNRILGVISLKKASASATGAIAATLPKLAQAVAGVEKAAGTVAQTLIKLAQAVTGAEKITGTAAQALPKLAQAVAGGVGQVVGVIAQALPALAQAVSAIERLTGTVAAALPTLAQAVAGVERITGAAAQTLAKLTQAVAGTLRVSGVTEQILPIIVQAASAAQRIAGSIAQALPALTQSAAGAFGSAAARGIATAIVGAVSAAVATVTGRAGASASVNEIDRASGEES